ncbi:MAG: SpoIIE family protein phosphatase [Bacteroidales bacterium]|jgi:serine phosphatase RsbU (regulator of sigma subunit)|nr:SpoIIE family protein phosphatase [Bacteroidales bacterium]
MIAVVDVFSSFIFNRFFIGCSEVFTNRQPDSASPVEIFYQSKLADLETRVTILIVALALVSMIAVAIFLLYQKNWKSQSLLIQKNEEIEEQQRSNDEIMQMLEQKKREIEQQSFELYETSTELKWQTENALRLYDEVEQQKQEMTDSIVYAKRIQTVLLPERTFINEILNDYFVLFQPRDIVSGDFYWVSAKTGKTVVAVADCTGHGVPGAFMSIMGITFLNAIVQPDNLHADIILNLLRKQVIKALKQTGKDLENKDGMDMALCIIDWENARIEYAGANIPLFLLRSTPTAADELIEVCADRMPIGIYATAASPFTRHSVPIMPGDSIYMFSDGYCDQFGGADLKKFKKKNLKKLLAEIHTFSMTEQKKRLKQNLDQWRGDLPQVDDILMLGIKI